MHRHSVYLICLKNEMHSSLIDYEVHPAELSYLIW